MTGLEKITASILEQAKANEEAILSYADSKAEKVLKEAETKAQAEYDGIVGKANEIAQKNIEVAESENDALRSRELLSAKVEAVYEVIDILKKEVLALPEPEYFAFMEHLVIRYATAPGGVVHFSARDLARLPKNFISDVNGKLEYKVTLSDTPAEIENGFILDFGDIEENCSIDALLLSMQDALKENIVQSLFAE